MKSGHLPGSIESFSRTRRALAQPRFLLAAMGIVTSGVVYLATAQDERPPVKMTSATPLPEYSLENLPAMIEAYGASRQATFASASSGGFTGSAIGNGQSGFNLVETDLTPNTPSDEREPATSPGGDFIAFMSTGKDSNGDGRIDSDGINAERRYHIWVMNRDGKNQRQVTGLAGDKALAQSHPTWSPDGNQLAYINAPGANAEIHVVNLRTLASERRTFNMPGEKRAPVWSPSGLNIAFACKANIDGDSSAASNQFDIFTIPASGASGTTNVVRLTGGSEDPVGNQAQDLNPTYAAVNSQAMYFSSNRNASGLLSKGRRIWRMEADGTDKVTVTDPTKRTYNGTQVGEVDDFDDYPSVSLSSGFSSLTGFNEVTEKLAFHSNTAVTPRDKTEGARDFNVWSLQVDSGEVGGSDGIEDEPRIFASDFGNGQLQYADPLKIAPNQAPTQPITGVTTPEGVVVQNSSVYVASRGLGQIVRFAEETGEPQPAFGRFGISFTDPKSIKDPSGMISDGSNFYVASGIGSTPNTTAIYRFDSSGTPTGRVVDNKPTGEWSFGEDDEGKITNGVEGLAFSDDGRYIYASVFSDNKINVYQRFGLDAGKYVTTLVKNTIPAGTGTAPNPNAPQGPTGLTLGPDLNGDGFRDLFVSSSKNDKVLAYMGPDPRGLAFSVGVDKDQAPGTFIAEVVSDNNGFQSSLNAPEGIYIVQRSATSYYLYVANFLGRGTLGSSSGDGEHINRYSITLTPATSTAPASFTRTSAPTAALVDPSIPQDATWLRFPGARGIAYFDFNDLAKENLAAGALPAPTPAPPAPSSLETQGDALVVSNILSSPETYAASNLNKAGNDVVGQDKASDIEPNFSRSSATADLSARLVFASSRRRNANPTSNVRDANGRVPRASNPYGYNVATNGVETQGTFDIWSTSTQDTTPPALIPQGAGNQLTPVVAPSSDAPFASGRARTPETGLRASTSSTPAYVEVAVVIRDLESGLDTSNIASGDNESVMVEFRQAGTERFQGYNSPPFTPGRSRVNEDIPVQIAIENRPNAVSVFGKTQFPLQPYDDGPVSNGGNERQSGAVAGDGVYYCAARLATPTTPGDFYMDFIVDDQADNPAFVYDNVWGFSTLPFQKVQDAKTDLFVSDYTAGQRFPYLLSGDERFFGMDPVESYWLSNPGGQALNDKNEVIAVSTPSTFSGVDVWRILSRGPVTTDVLDSYRPRETFQIDPNETSPGENGPFTAPTRNLAVSDASVIWGAPYAGTVFAGPGTIVDPETQTNLTAFLSSGGRLFLSGRDVARSLTNENTVGNTFLTEEMGAQFSKEVTSNVLTHNKAGDFLSNVIGYGAFADLQIPSTGDAKGTFRDAASNQDGVGTSIEGYYIDSFTPQSGEGTEIATSYTAGGGIVGQRIEKVRANGLKSRAVFFGFGLEAVNRRYRKPSDNDGRIALNVRRVLASQILQYFKTGAISGTVTSSGQNGSNSPIPNFLVLVRREGGGEDERYLARTDAQGQYELSGLPPGFYTVEPALLKNGALVSAGTVGAKTSPAGFFGGTQTDPSYVFGEALLSEQNLQLTPLSPGSIRGRITTSRGTPFNFADDSPRDTISDKAVDVPVLLRSVEESSTVAGAGRYAALTRTDAGGLFSFGNVPSDIELEVIINPNINDPSTPANEGDIPIESEFYSGYQATGPKTNIGRRVLPDARHPEKVIAPIGNTFTLNDPDPVKYPDPATGPAAGSADTDVAADSGQRIVVPEGAPVSGVVQLNNKALSGATVELLDGSGNSFPEPRIATTTSGGTYSFSDVIVGTYKVRVTAIASGITITKTTGVNQPARTSNRPYTGARVNFSLFLATVSGQVNLNGQPAPAGVRVKLYFRNGAVFRPERRTATVAGGKYALNFVPTGEYKLIATLGTAAGSVDITVPEAATYTAPTINLVSREVTGSVARSTNGASAVPAEGATVELLNTSGTAVARTTTDAQGNYKFAAVTDGTYTVRVTLGTQTKSSASFTTSTTTTTVPRITFNVQVLQGTVLNPQGAPQVGAGVTLTSGTQSQTVTTDSQGKFTFSSASAGAYKVVAVFNDLRGESSGTITEGTAPAAITIRLVKDTSAATTYSGRGKIYYISIPYEDGNSPTTNNGANFADPATVPIAKAFTVLPFDANGAQNYSLQRYDATTNQLVPLNNNSIIQRGAGYILQVMNNGTSLKSPTNDPNLKALTDSRFDKTYTVTLRLNPSARDAASNGRNLIGFGFDPARFSSVAWETALVTHPDGRTAQTITEAAKNGWLINNITTAQYSGTTLTTVPVSQLKPFIGYFVQTRVNGLKITFRNPVTG